MHTDTSVRGGAPIGSHVIPESKAKKAESKLNFVQAAIHKIEKGINSLAIMFKPKMERLLIEEEKLIAKINKLRPQLHVGDKHILEKEKKGFEIFLDKNNEQLKKLGKDDPLRTDVLKSKKYFQNEINRIEKKLNEITNIDKPILQKQQAIEQKLDAVQKDISSMRQAEKVVHSLGENMRGIETRLDRLVNDFISAYKAEKKIPQDRIKELKNMKDELELAKKEINKEIKKHPEWHTNIVAKLHVINDRIDKAELILEHEKTRLDYKLGTFEDKFTEAESTKLEQKLSKQKEEIDRNLKPAKEKLKPGEKEKYILKPAREKFLETDKKVSDTNKALAANYKDLLECIVKYNGTRSPNAPGVNLEAPLFKEVTNAYNKWIADPESTEKIDSFKTKIDQLLLESNVEIDPNIDPERANLLDRFPKYREVFTTISNLSFEAKYSLNVLKAAVQEKNELLPSKELEEINAAYKPSRKLEGVYAMKQIIDDVEKKLEALGKSPRPYTAMLDELRDSIDKLERLANNNANDDIFNKNPKVLHRLNTVLTKLLEKEQQIKAEIVTKSLSNIALESTAISTQDAKDSKVLAENISKVKSLQEQLKQLAADKTKALVFKDDPDKQDWLDTLFKNLEKREQILTLQLQISKYNSEIGRVTKDPKVADADREANIKIFQHQINNCVKKINNLLKTKSIDEQLEEIKTNKFVSFMREIKNTEVLAAKAKDLHKDIETLKEQIEFLSALSNESPQRLELLGNLFKVKNQIRDLYLKINDYNIRIQALDNKAADREAKINDFHDNIKDCLSELNKLTAEHRTIEQQLKKKSS